MTEFRNPGKMFYKAARIGLYIYEKGLPEDQIVAARMRFYKSEPAFLLFIGGASDPMSLEKSHDCEGGIAFCLELVGLCLANYPARSVSMIYEHSLPEEWQSFWLAPDTTDQIPEDILRLLKEGIYPMDDHAPDLMNNPNPSFRYGPTAS